MRPWTVLAALLLAAPDAGADTPNVVVVFVDDLGARDLGYCGNTFHETPHLDRLARESADLTTAYSACTVCSPSRAALLTGQNPARLRVTDWIAGHQRPYARLKVPDWTRHLPTSTYTLAKAFRAKGYQTAHVGKWHLGGTDHSPERHDFHVNVAGTHQGQPGSHLAPYGIANLADDPARTLLSERLTRETTAFILANRDRPFFVVLSHYAVHTPLKGKPAVVEKYRQKATRAGRKDNAAYAALVESVDDSVGAVRQTLADCGLTRNTIVVFTSDNGGLTPITQNAPLRAGKGTAYEGGVRVPCLVCWPGRVPAGQKLGAPVVTHDLFPTLAEACGLSVPADHAVDGLSLMPYLTQQKPPARDALHWHYPHYHTSGATPYSAIRAGDWKLIEYYEGDRLELYDLASDPGEAKNLAAAVPERARELKAKLDAWRRQVSAQPPTPNPEYDPVKDRAPKKTKK